MHNHNWERGWRRMEAMSRRGFRGWSGFNFNPGEFGNWGGNFRIGRMLASGDLRLVALYLIEQQPRHGYDLIKAIEEKSAHFYSPSPGFVYPALTFLEEAGYVTSATEGNKKLYTITDEGRAHLADNREAIESVLNFLGKAGAQMQEWREMMQENAQRNPDERSEGSDAADGEAGPVPPAPPPPPFPGEGRGPGPRGFGPAHWHDHPRHGHGPGFGPGSGPGAGRGDWPEDLDEARKALKRAIKDAAQQGREEALRVAGILRRAAEAIRNGDDEHDL